MKKAFFLFIVLMLFSFVFSSCENLADSEPELANNIITELPYSGLAPFAGIDPESQEYQEKLEELGIVQVVWNSELDRAKAANITAVQNTNRKDASGIKITSNAHSDDFPGIYFIWEPKQKDSGFLKVSAPVFRFFESFTLTAKQANAYWDFIIAPIENQQLTVSICLLCC